MHAAQHGAALRTAQDYAVKRSVQLAGTLALIRRMQSVVEIRRTVEQATEFPAISHDMSVQYTAVVSGRGTATVSHHFGRVRIGIALIQTAAQSFDVGRHARAADRCVVVPREPVFFKCPRVETDQWDAAGYAAGDIERVIIIDRNASLSADHTLAEIVFVLGLVRALRRPPLANSRIERQGFCSHENVNRSLLAHLLLLSSATHLSRCSAFCRNATAARNSGESVS